MMTAILVLGLAASTMNGRHAMALIRAGHERPLREFPSPMPDKALLAAQLAVPVLGFFHVVASLWVALLILVVALATLSPPVRSARPGCRSSSPSLPAPRSRHSPSLSDRRRPHDRRLHL